MTYRAGWTRLSDGSWGIEVRDTPDDLSGQTITVTKKDGTTSQVTLGSLVSENEYGKRYSVGLGAK
jgi:hypothetical protein